MSRLRPTLAAVCAVLAACTLVACSSSKGAVGDVAAAPSSSVNFDPPVGTTWVTGPVGLSYPVSGSDGPFELDPVPHGFSNTPQGAVIAAVVSQVFMAGAGDDLWPEVSRLLLEPGVGRDQWAQARAVLSVSDAPLESPPVFRGYRIAQFSPDKAIVVLAVQYSNMLAVLPVQMSGASGQWRVVVPPQTQAPDLTEITEQDLAADYTVFSPEGDLS